MKNMLTKKLIVAIIIAIIILLQSQVFATGGQASGTSNSLDNKSVSYYFELIRSMETSTGTLGKSSNINTTNYVDSSGNGIDCHLEKNTEYGTITILAASEYGNKTSTATASTGAKNTGVFQMSPGHVSSEYMANIWQQDENSAPKATNYNKALVNADSRYVNKYIGAKHSIQGDGIIETDGWGGATGFVSENAPVFMRGHTGLFGYFSTDGGIQSAWRFGRAVVVCATGL